MNTFIVLMNFFIGYVSPVTPQENEACRGAESVLLASLNSFSGYIGNRQECLIKLKSQDVINGYYDSYVKGRYYNVLGCVKNSDNSICRGYTIYVPSCTKCVYGMVSNYEDLTANYNEIKRRLILE